MTQRSAKVWSLTEYLERTAALRDRWIGGRDYFDPWFRGHTDAAWPLTPLILRLELLEDEDEIRTEFRRRGVQLAGERPPTTDWEWYFLMQHYGAPTRLLDWTSSSLVALHFALNSQPAGRQTPTCDAAVWMLDPWWLNQQVLRLKTIVLPDWGEARPYLPALFDGKLRRKLPIAIDPPHVARRVAVQQSRFTIHGTAANGLELLAKRRGARIKRIDIAQAAITRMRVDLYTAGVADTSVFPDLQGLGQELSRYFTDDW